MVYYNLSWKSVYLGSKFRYTMKRILTTALLLALAVLPALAQGNLKYTEASELTMVGKLMTDTPNPYHRVDTARFKGFTPPENAQVRMSAGLAVVFRTNSKVISVKTVYGKAVEFPSNTSGFSARGYDLYMKRDGQWLWCSADVAPDRRLDAEIVLGKGFDGTMHECLLYLPILSEEYSIKIGVEEDAVIEAIENPFRHRVGIFGSSYTHGISTSRAGMSYPSQFMRMTGIQLLNLGCSGNCKLQPYFAEVLCAADMDALIVDGFSNPSPQLMEERLFPFIEKVQSAHPGMPIIFQKTIYRENRNFQTDRDKLEADKMTMADSLMNIAVKKYQDVYYLDCTNATSEDHESTQDGIHPSDYGYTLWARSISKPVLKILRKYGIK